MEFNSLSLLIDGYDCNLEKVDDKSYQLSVTGDFLKMLSNSIDKSTMTGRSTNFVHFEGHATTLDGKEVDVNDYFVKLAARMNNDDLDMFIKVYSFTEHLRLSIEYTLTLEDNCSNFDKVFLVTDNAEIEKISSEFMKNININIKNPTFEVIDISEYDNEVNELSNDIDIYREILDDLKSKGMEKPNLLDYIIASLCFVSSMPFIMLIIFSIITPIIYASLSIIDLVPIHNNVVELILSITALFIDGILLKFLYDKLWDRLIIRINLACIRVRRKSLQKSINLANAFNYNDKYEPILTKLNTILEFKNDNHVVHRLYEFLDVKKSTSEFLFIDYGNKDKIIERFNGDESQHEMLSTKQQVMVSNVISDEINVQEFEDILNIINRYNDTLNELEYQKEYAKYQEIYGNSFKKASHLDSEYIRSLSEIYDDLERINQDIEVMKKSKIKDTQSLVENMVKDKQA